MAGETLRVIGSPGERVMARKPHTAYFAGMEFTPIPRVDSIFELIQSAGESGTEYLFFSGLEANLRRQFEVLVDTALVYPGLDLIEFRKLEKNHFYALYRFTGEPVNRESLEAVLAVALERQTVFAPDDPTPRVSAALHLIQQGRYEEALAEAEEAERLSPGNFGAATCRSMALYALGRYEESAEACERAIADGSRYPWFRAQLGQIRLVQGRFAEGALHARVAVESEPTNIEFLGILGMALFQGGEYAEAAEVLGRALELQPNSSQGRLYAGWALALSGNPGRALEVLDMETRTDIPEAAIIRHLADSLRTELR
jgi:tetratricopeptide (TPR) repeat protein